MSISKLFCSSLLIVVLLLTFVGQAQAQDPLPPQPGPIDEPLHGPGPQQDETGLWYMPDGLHSNSLMGEVEPLAAGGPDDFGYTWSDEVALSWIDTTAGTDTGLTGYDDATGAIALPFPFKYYENTYSQVYIAAPGYLAFTDAGYWNDQSVIPDPSEPNNVIAPYWTPTYIGTGSWVHYLSGGSAPNRYFVVEWHDVRGTDPTDIGDDDIYRFQVILHENGDIVFQYQNMIVTGSWFCGSSGIEDALGLDGLTSLGFCYMPPSNKAVRFYRPPVAARVKFEPRQDGSFVTTGQTRTFPVSVFNTGELGADTYDLTVSSAWPVSLYASNGTDLLTDTDSDGIPDTGEIPQGGSLGIIVSVIVPGAVGIGDSDQIALTASSSIDPAQSKVFRLGLAIPSNFAGVFKNDDDGAMQLLLARPSGQNTFKIAPDDSYGYNPAVALTPNGNYLYAWNKSRDLGDYWVTEIEYAIVAKNGSVTRPVSKLRDLSSATWYERDYSPSISVAPNDTMGVAWRHYSWNYSVNAYLYDIYFTLLNSQGNLIYGPVNVTNNTDPSTRFYDVSIAATDDNRFMVGMRNYNTSTYNSNVGYVIYDAAGVKVFGPQLLTADNQSWGPVLNSLPGGKAIITWLKSSGGPYFTVLNSNGAIVKPETNLNSGTVYYSPDAVALPNGKVAVAWGTSSGIGLSILDSAYAVESGPVNALNSYSTTYNDGVSITTDISSRVILSWSQGDTYRNLFYALADSSGTFLTSPLPYQKSTNGISGSWNGQGIAPLDAIPDPWVGGISIESDQNIVAVGRPHVGSQVASYIASGAGSTEQYVPMLFKDAFGGAYDAALYIQNQGNAPANLSIEFRNDTGTVVHTLTEPLAAKASKGYWLPSIADLGASFVGSAKVTSDQPVLAVGRPHINGEVMTYNGIAAGSTTAWLPMFFKDGYGGSYNTALYVQNLTGNSATLTIEYLNLDGTVACTDNDTLDANASKGYWSKQVICDTGSLPAGFVGGVKVTSTENILTVGRAHLGTQITTYNGFAGGAPTAYVPMLFRKALTGNSYNAALYLQNVSGSSAEVVVEYVDNTGAVAATQNVTLAAGAISSIWLPSVAGLPDGFVGGARITATQDVIAVGRPHLGSEITAYNGASTGSLNASLPMLFKNAFGGSYDAAFYIQNVTGSAATVDIKFYDDAGTLSCIKTVNLAGNATTGFWMPTTTCTP